MSTGKQSIESHVKTEHNTLLIRNPNNDHCTLAPSQCATKVYKILTQVTKKNHFAEVMRLLEWFYLVVKDINAF